MSRSPLPRLLAGAARRYQLRHVLPHCADCRTPCCELGTLVLELTWRRLRGIWGIEGSRADFDRRLAHGDGPGEIRPQEGLYYAHGRPCPAYQSRRCSVYDTPLKPSGCSDFPVYEEDGALIADLRCEAVTLPAVEAEMAEALGTAWRVEHWENPDFPFLVSLRPRRSPVRSAGRKRERGTGRGRVCRRAASTGARGRR